MNKLMIYFITLLAAVFFIPMERISAQSDSDESQITIDAMGEVQIPADLIHFQVNITQFKDSAREAFELHKQQEQFLTNLLLEEGIADSNIVANPISINHVRRHNNTMESGYETRQQVLIVLDDVSRFESMQIKLIENGFTSFSGSFASTQTEKASNKALKKAFEQARLKAEVLAEAAEKEITDVISINYHTGRVYSARAESMQMAFDASGGSLLQFERTIPIRENVTVQFRIE